jgi:hypothetical protein
LPTRWAVRWRSLIQAADELAASPGERPLCAEGFTSLLNVALAREDRGAANQFSGLLQDCVRDIPRLEALTRQVIARELRNAPIEEQAETEFLGPQALSVLVFNNERGIRSTPELIMAAATNTAAYRSRATEIACALRDGDDDVLAASIANLEHRGRIVSAARLRVVHAARTGDHESLHAARATLERIGDRRFLRRLDQVELAIGTRATDTGSPA